LSAAQVLGNNPGAGRSCEARAALAQLGKREQTGFRFRSRQGACFLELSDTTAALDWLEKAFAERSYVSSMMA
jgi:hypothetical protein